MHQPLYRQAITHSWKLIWQHKLLWPFGLFAAFLGQMGLVDFLSRVSISSSTLRTSPLWYSLPTFFADSSAMGSIQLPLDGWMWLFWLVMVLVGFGAMFVFVSVVSQGAIIHAVGQSIKKKKLHVDTAWDAGVSHFWRLFFLNLLKKILFWILAGVIGWATLEIVMAPTATDIFAFIILFVLVSFIGLFLSFFTIYAAGYIVIEEYRFFEALRAAWKLCMGHWLVSLEIGLILVFLQIVFGLVTAASFLLFLLPTLLLASVGAATGVGGIIVFAVFVGLTLFILFVIFVASLFTLFSTSLWSYLFMKMHKEGVVSRLLHWLKWQRA